MNKRWLLALVAALVIYLGLGLVFGLRDLGSTLQKLPLHAERTSRKKP